MAHLHHFLIPILLASSAVASAQSAADKVKVKVRISSDSEAEGKLMPVNMIRSGPGHLMVLRSGEFDVRAFGTLKTSLDLYDANKLTYVRSIEPSGRSEDGQDVKLDALVHFAGKPMLIGHSTSDAGVTVYHQPQEPALTRLGGRYVPLVTWKATVMEKKPVIVSAGASLRTPFMVVLASDSSHMLIASPEIRSKETGDAVYLMAVIGQDLAVKWQQIVNVSAEAKGSSLEDIEVDNLGNAYLVVRNALESREAKGSKVKHELKLLVANAGGVQDAKLKLGGTYYPTSATLMHTTDDRVVCAGVYGSETEGGTKRLGNFISVFPAGSAEPGTPTIIPFTGSGLEGESDEEGSDSKAVAKDKEKMEYNNDVIALRRLSNGGFFLVNEVFTVTDHYDMTLKRHVTLYIHGPVQVRCLDRDGKERWSTIFRRWVTTTNPILGRVFCAEFDDQLFLFLLDSEEMAERRKAGSRISSKHMKGPYSAYVTFDDKGDYKVKPVLRGEKDNDYISGWEMVRTGPAEYFALGTEKLVSGRFLPVKIEFSR